MVKFKGDFFTVWYMWILVKNGSFSDNKPYIYYDNYVLFIIKTNLNWYSYIFVGIVET